MHACSVLCIMNSRILSKTDYPRSSYAIWLRKPTQFHLVETGHRAATTAFHKCQYPVHMTGRNRDFSQRVEKTSKPPPAAQHSRARNDALAMSAEPLEYNRPTLQTNFRNRKKAFNAKKSPSERKPTREKQKYNVRPQYLPDGPWKRKRELSPSQFSKGISLSSGNVIQFFGTKLKHE